MKNKTKILWIALAAVFTFSTVACSGGGKKLNSAQELRAYLDKLPQNNSDKPAKVFMNAINEQAIREIAAVIMSTDKYVSLDLSGSSLRAIPDYAFYDREREKGCDKLISIILPKRVNAIGQGAFLDCNDLKLIIPKSVTIVNGEEVSSGTYTVRSLEK